MNEKTNLLIIEDDKASIDEFIEDARAYLPKVNVVNEIPPKELLLIETLVNKHEVSAVVVDERLRQRSEANYLGIDVRNYLAGAFPDLPVFILTGYDRDSDLINVPHWALYNKADLIEDKGKKDFYNILSEKIDAYQAKQENIKDHKQEVAQIVSTEPTEENIKKIAQLHFSLDNEIEQINWFVNKQRPEICFIEVNRTALSTDLVEPFLIPASEGLPLPLLIADVTPKEWEKIQEGKIELPDGWDIATVKIFKRNNKVNKG